MKDSEREQSLIRQYLLGELDDQQREQLEQRVITNADYKEEVLMSEEELLDDFVNDRLSRRELELFHQKYSSSPSLSRKVELARTLNQYAANHRIVLEATNAQRSWVRSLLGFFYQGNRFRQLSLAILILLLVGGTLLVVYWRISQGRRVDYNALMRLNGPGSEILPPDHSVVSVSLSSLLLRGAGDVRSVTITEQTQTVQLRLADLSGGEVNLFRARLKDSAGSEVFSLEDLQARQQSSQFPGVVLQVPARMLVPQQYQLEISGKKPDGSYEDPITYTFRVQRVQL